jgi:gamma-glutamylcyclotransferase (GGCT)/AIG2-like uncharacterized protein YtfP
MSSKKLHVFVYGTLKRGCWNSHLLSDSNYLGTFETEDKFILGNAGYPYAFPHYTFPNLEDDNDILKPVLGELYEVPFTDLSRLDWLEGYIEGSDYNHYERIKVNLKDTDVMPWMYVQEEAYMVENCGRCHDYEGVWIWHE